MRVPTVRLHRKQTSCEIRSIRSRSIAAVSANLPESGSNHKTAGQPGGTGHSGTMQGAIDGVTRRTTVHFASRRLTRRCDYLGRTVTHQGYKYLALTLTDTRCALAGAVRLLRRERVFALAGVVHLVHPFNTQKSSNRVAESHGNIPLPFQVPQFPLSEICIAARGYVRTPQVCSGNSHDFHH